MPNLFEEVFGNEPKQDNSAKKRAKMLENVRALLAKANDPSVGDAEAEVFRQKADHLMALYSITEWQVAQEEAGRQAEGKPVRRDFDRAWRSSRFSSEMMYLFMILCDHCRCVFGVRGIDYSTNTAPVYGLPSDLDYLDALYTMLDLEVAKNLTPPVDPNGEVGHEVFKQRQAGINWPEITRKVYEAGLVKLTKGEYDKIKDRAERRRERGYDAPDIASMKPDEVNWDHIQRALIYSDWGKDDARTSIKNRLANFNRRYVKDNGLQGERNYVKPEVFQRSFMMGFRYEIETRCINLRNATERAYDSEHGANSMALVVRDIRSQALDLYKQEFPPPPPVPINPNAKPPRGRALKVREVAVDYGAVSAGRAKAREVNLSNKPSQRVGREGPRLKP